MANIWRIDPLFLNISKRLWQEVIFKSISYIKIEYIFTLFDLSLLYNDSKFVITSDVTMDQNLHGNICLNIIALASILSY